MVQKTSDFNNRLTSLLESGQNFSLVRLPGEETFILNCDLAILPFGFRWEEQFGISDNNRNLDIFFPSTDQGTYLNSVGQLIGELKINHHKVVISRIIDGRLPSVRPSAIAKSVERLFKKNPDAFAGVIRSESAGLWIVMTPELLLAKHNDRLSTMALAGTRPKEGNKEWDKKNVDEQRIVTEYIADCFKRVGLTSQTEKSYTKVAGNVEHICTPIKAILNKNINLGTIIDKLNPTPAVCGFPCDYALNEIRRIENHSRLLYAGAVAVKNTETDLTVFVTLRCIHISNDGRFNIFVGSGITGDSTAQDEWDETELKAVPFIDSFTLS